MASWERVFLAVCLAGWLSLASIFVIYQPDRAVIFCRIFWAVLCGFAKLAGF